MKHFVPWPPRPLTPISNPTGYSFTWQDGSHQPTFQASEYGTYWVEVRKGCGVVKDTITFKKAELGALEINLGEDKRLCPFVPVVLEPLPNSIGFAFLWQDGSTGTSFTAERFGEYSVTVQSECQIGMDTIEFSKLEIEPILPNVFTPNDDSKNQTFMIEESFWGARLDVYNRWGKKVYQSINYRNTFDAAGLSTGIYYYIIEAECLGQRKGWISVIR